MLSGSEYVATTRLTNLAGEVLAAEGETCERVPAASLGWLERDGLIQPRPVPAEPPARRTKGKE